MDSPYKALKVLLASEENLDELMDEIEDFNTKRKVSTLKFLDHALTQVDETKNIIFYDSTSIEHGII
jgi:single-stranded DNA-specific DHH superfamily exonuclease